VFVALADDTIATDDRRVVETPTRRRKTKMTMHDVVFL
jgi:hypothetical protein